MTRPPTHKHRQAPDAGALADLEELGDDAIIAQQTEAHAPKPRANVADEARSVVITDHPRATHSQPRRSQPRATGEATLVIRDRRALDEIRQGIVKRQAQKRRGGHRALYTWGALGVAAFVLGGLVAFLATDSRADGAARADPASAGKAYAPPGEPAVAPPSPTETPRAVKLDDLPVEHTHKH